MIQQAQTRNIDSEAVALAEQLLQLSKEHQTQLEIKQAEKIGGMMDDPNGKTLTMLLPDQAFRSKDAKRVANQVRHLTSTYGVPKYLLPLERIALGLGNLAGQVLPKIVVPAIVAKLRQETENVILPGEARAFSKYLSKRRAMNTRLNINYLGEAILGEGEAQRRLEAYLDLLANPEIEYISVKISSIFSQINLVAFEHTVDEIKVRLRKLYRQAMAHQYILPDGTSVPKFVNLDMEEYRDLHLTMAAFQQVLNEPEFMNDRAGIVLQAYLPDSFPAQRELTQWAIRRVANGGAPIKLRIVKGANLAMEQVEAALHHWELAPYDSKHEVDANYKRMVTYGCTPERARAVNLGVASHNLFDISYAMLLREQERVHDYVEFEMLEGMANHQARAVRDRADGLLLYAPVVKQEDFHSAIAYLMRRLDENTADENFLRDLFDLEVNSPQWDKQKQRFIAAFDAMDTVREGPKRTQNRATETFKFDPTAPFENVADTDFSLRANQLWIKDIIQQWSTTPIETIPLQICGDFRISNHLGEGSNPSKPGQVAYRYSLATPDDIEQAVQSSVDAKLSWRQRSSDEKKKLLVRSAELLAERRGELIGVMMIDGGKTVAQADPEVSEAIDFANYYARSFDPLTDELQQTMFEPFGVVLVTPPWNFPLAIPAGGVLAALMAGNTVILKPAPEATLVGWHLANALWDAGIPKDVLQFCPTTDDAVGKSLVTDERVDAVILTGAYETARMFLDWKPERRLFAETSGKNAMIITAMSDRDQAIKDLVKSAFGHGGQKCSAASLAILEREVYEDASFLRQLKDAAQSLQVGPANQLHTIVAPVIRQPDKKLSQALTTLESGEEWLLKPVQLTDTLWKPGIKLGVQAASFFHKTECFGPVLGLMCAESLEHAIELANAVEYGLTGGLQSLDDREIALWREEIQAGNAYINRVTTGAIVQRQPFGGWKRSAFGYAKAGGPNYVLSLGNWRDREDIPNTYQQAWEEHYSQEHDPSRVYGETNIFRYIPIKRMLVRFTESADAKDISRLLKAAELCGVPLRLSAAMGEFSNIDNLIIERDEDFLAELSNPAYQYRQRLRVFGDVSPAIRQAAIEQHVPIIECPIVASGRLELRHFMLEQAISQTMHRYGNIYQKPS